MTVAASGKKFLPHACSRFNSHSFAKNKSGLHKSIFSEVKAWLRSCARCSEPVPIDKNCRRCDCRPHNCSEHHCNNTTNAIRIVGPHIEFAERCNRQQNASRVVTNELDERHHKHCSQFTHAALSRDIWKRFTSLSANEPAPLRARPDLSALRLILLVGDFLHPLDRFSVQRFLDCNMGHGYVR